MNWKDMLKTVLGPLVAYMFTQLVSHYPDFPLFSDEFVSLILWIIGIAIGGWQLAMMRVKSKLSKAGYKYENLVK